MKYICHCFVCILISVVSCTSHEENYTRYVNPFIGTGGHGHTFPGAIVPFGMVQLSPDNPSKGWDWTSGYHYSDSVLFGFSHTHLSGTGVGDLLDILVVPFISNYPENTLNEFNRINYRYTHSDEEASPGYYSINLDKGNIKAELSASERIGFHKYTFHKSADKRILIDPGYAQNWDRPVDTWIKVLDDKTIVGFRKSSGWAKNQKIYFALKSSRSFHAVLFKDKIKCDSTEVSAEKSEAVLEFNNSADEILLKVSLSSASINGALQNLLVEENHRDFEKIKSGAEGKWQKELSKIKITKGSVEDKIKFYTALFHCYTAPYLFSDLNNEYYGADGKIHKAEGYNRYTLFSLWDTFRALHPLLTITQPDLVDNLVKSMIAFYDEYGLLPTWDLMSNETNVMIGYHAVPVIVDAYFKGLTSVDPLKLFEAIKTSAMQNSFGIKYYKKLGYIPSDLEIESVSKTLEYAFDDWCIAQLAKAVNLDDDYKYFLNRSNSYKLLFDKSTGFMRGKDQSGNWITNFNPLYVSHRKSDYTEANAWQYTWHVLHDVEGLIQLFGGEEPFIVKLDSLFTISPELEGTEVSPDISGLIGQYAHGNEPCHHIAYLYNFTNKTWKAQERVNDILNTMYKAEPVGLCGNDDCGQMSAWYVFSSLGFYPVNPADGKYWFGSPQFEEVEIEIPEDKKFTIIAHKENKESIYIESVRLNGKKLNRNYVTHTEIMQGGELEFFMTGSIEKY